MSEAARRERAIKRHWAEPGSRHDRVVKLAKFALPMAIAGLVALLALAPFDKRGDVSFILDKNKVDKAPERMRVEAARYTGEDDKGQSSRSAPTARSSRPATSRWSTSKGCGRGSTWPRGRCRSSRQRGRYDLDTAEVAIDGPVRVAGPDGYRLETRDVGVDIKQRQLASQGRSSGAMRLGQFEAGRMSADLGDAQGRADGRGALENRARGGQMRGMVRLLLLAAALAAALAASAGAGAASGPVSALKGHDSNAPVDVAADRIEVQDRADRAIFAGNVHVRQGELTLDTARLTVAYSIGRRASRSTGSTPAAG